MREQGQTGDIMWTVFVPSHILNKSSCHLFGKVIEENSFVLISDIFYKERGCEKSIGIFSQLDETELKTDEEGTHKPTKDLFIDLHCNRDGNITCKVTENFETLNCNLVIFDAEQFSDSYFMSWDSLSTVSGNVVNILSKEIQSSRPTVRKPLIHQLQMLWLFCFQIVGFLLDNRVTRLGPISFAVSCSSLLVHQTKRRQEYLTAKNSDSSSLKTQLGLANLCWRQLLDCVLGITFTYFFINYNMTDYVAALIITWAYEVAENLHSLVEWLMGAPAGLKLNKQLTEFLGHFFLYHIYLWKGYLGILQTVLSSMLWYSSLLGLLGITAQLCFLRDVISMMSLHIYCFYVYAARLYRFQVYALSAFWRLFRGKKWNVLRQRLDSVRYDVDQLFLGTLLFTILLFTLPTCALYYVVFTMLRLVVLLAHELIDKVIQSLDLLPLYSVWMWCINSRYIKGDILFSIIPHSERDESSTFSLQIIQMPFRKLLKRSENPFRNAASQHYHWSKLIGDLVKGHLIYPWVELSQS